MIKRIGLLILAACFALMPVAPVQVQAQGDLVILDSSTDVNFPSSLRFNLSAQSSTDIIDIRLHYTVRQISYAQVTAEVFVDFTADTSVDASYTLDMRQTGGLPPGTVVEYWWTVKDTGDNVVESSPVQVVFEDNRYSWQSLTAGDVTIYWYEGGLAFTQQLMAAAQEALARLLSSTGASLENPASIYIYASTEDLLGAMIYPPDWAGGGAFIREGTIVIGIAPNQLDWGMRAVAHELAHLVIGGLVLNPYSDLPKWLNEGLSMYIEGPLEIGYLNYLDEAVTEDSLISVRSLASSFSAHAEQSYLSYAQSYSLVDFLIRGYGQEQMLALLYTFKEGSGYDDALEKIYGFDMDGLDALWKDYITRQIQPAGGKGLHPAAIGGLSVLVLALFMVVGLFIKGWVNRRKEEIRR